MTSSLPVLNLSVSEARSTGSASTPPPSYDYKDWVDWICDGDLTRVKASHAVQPGGIRETEDGITLLMWAAGFGETDIVRWLLDQGVPVNACDLAGRTAVHWAARKGRPECIEVLLQHPEINVKIRSGGAVRTTALMVAAELGHVPCTRLLMRQIDINALDGHMESALDKAAAKGYKQCVLALLEVPELKPERIQSALLSACGSKKWDCLDVLSQRVEAAQWKEILAQAPAGVLPQTQARVEHRALVQALGHPVSIPGDVVVLPPGVDVSPKHPKPSKPSKLPSKRL